LLYLFLDINDCDDYMYMEGRPATVHAHQYTVNNYTIKNRLEI